MSEILTNNLQIRSGRGTAPFLLCRIGGWKVISGSGSGSSSNKWDIIMGDNKEPGNENKILVHWIFWVGKQKMGAVLGIWSGAG